MYQTIRVRYFISSVFPNAILQIYLLDPLLKWCNDAHMQIHLPIFTTNGFSGVETYIAASNNYLNSTHHRRKMEYVFPNIHEQCPLCSASGCARWKGYYTRCMQDSTLSLLQKIVIRYGRCQRYRIEFSFLPDFLMPRRRLSIPTVSALSRAAKGTQTKLQSAIDTVISPWREDLYLPCSTVYNSLNAFITLLKTRYAPAVTKSRRIRWLSEPDRFGTDLILSVQRVLARLNKANPAHS